MLASDVFPAAGTSGILHACIGDGMQDSAAVPIYPCGVMVCAAWTRRRGLDDLECKSEAF